MALTDLVSDLSRFRNPLSTQPIVPSQEKQGPQPFVTTPLANRVLPGTNYTSVQSPLQVGPTVSGTSPIGRHDGGDTSGLNIDGTPESTDPIGRHDSGDTSGLNIDGTPESTSPSGRHTEGAVVPAGASPSGRHTDAESVPDGASPSGRHTEGKVVPDGSSPSGRHIEGKVVPDGSSPIGRHTEGKEVSNNVPISGRHEGNISNGLNIDGVPTPSILSGRHTEGTDVDSTQPSGRHTEGKEVRNNVPLSGRLGDGPDVDNNSNVSGRHTTGKEVDNGSSLSGRHTEGKEVTNESKLSGRHTTGVDNPNTSATSGRHDNEDTSNLNYDGTVQKTNPAGRHDGADTSELNYDGTVPPTNPKDRHDQGDTSNLNYNGTVPPTNPKDRHDQGDTSNFNIDGNVPVTNPKDRHDQGDTSNLNYDGAVPVTNPKDRHDGPDTSNLNYDGAVPTTNPKDRHDGPDTSQLNYDGTVPPTNPAGRHDGPDTSQLNYDGTVPPTNPQGRHDSGDTSQLNYDGVVPPTNPIGRHDGPDTSNLNYDGTVPVTNPQGRHDSGDTSQYNIDGPPPPTTPAGRHDSGDTSIYNIDGPPPPTTPSGRHDQGDTSQYNIDGPPTPTVTQGRHDSGDTSQYNIDGPPTPTVTQGRHDDGDTSIYNIDGTPNKYKNILDVNGLHGKPHDKKHSFHDRDGDPQNNAIGTTGNFIEGVGGLRINDKYQASKWKEDENYTNLYTVGASKINSQLGQGTDIPNAGQIIGHPVFMKSSEGGFHDDRKYNDVVKRLSTDGLGNQYEIKNSPSFLDAEYSKFKVRDEAHNTTYIKHPLILRGIQRDGTAGYDPQRWGFGIGFDDGLIRGGVVTAAERALVDTVRIAKWMVSPKGLLWIVKNIGLGLTNPNVETLASITSPVPTIGQTKIHTGLASLLSVPGSPFGLHFTRHGIPFANEVASYEFVHNAMKQAATLNQKSQGGNRLVKLLGESSKPLSLPGLPWFTLSGITGPGSVYGIGGTKITRTVNTFGDQALLTPPGLRALNSINTLVGIAKFPTAAEKGLGQNPEVKVDETNAYAPSFAAFKTSTTGGDPGEFLTNFDENKTKSETTTWKAGFETPELRAKLHDFTGQGGRSSNRTKEAAFRGNPYMTYNQRYGYIPDLDTPAEGPTVYAPKFRADSYGMDPSTAHPDAGSPNGNFADNTGGTLQEFDNDHTTLGKTNFNELVEKTGLMDDTGGSNPESNPKAKSKGLEVGIKAYSTLAYSNIPAKGKTIGDSVLSYQDFRLGMGADNKVTKQGENAKYSENNLTTKYGFGNHGLVDADRSDPDNIDRLDRATLLKKSRGDKINLIDANVNTKNGKTVKYDDIYPEGTKDFVRFYFTGPKQMPKGSAIKNEVLAFRATIGAITDSFNPSWTATNILGRADPVHVYSGWGRTFNFDFKVYATAREEMKTNWRKLNYLASWTGPRYSGSGKMRGPYLRVTLGNLFQETPCFISSLSYSMDAETPWEINASEDPDMLQLPHGVSVSIGLTMLMDYRPEWNSRMYSLSERGSAEKKLPGSQWLYDASNEPTTADDKEG